MDDLINQFDKIAADASDDTLEVERWINETVHAMMHAYSDQFLQIIMTEALTLRDKRGAERARAEAARNRLHRWAMVPTVRFSNRLEAALRAILRREILGE